jgi:BON domain
MRRTRYPSRGSDRNGFLFFVAGTLSGVAAGVYLARRYNSGGELVEAVRAKLGAFREFWNAEDELEDEREDEFDDELEAGERERRLVDAYEDEVVDDDEPAALPAGVDAGLPDDPPVTGEFLETPPPTMDRSAERDLEARVLAVFVGDDVLRDRAVDIAAVGTGVIELSGWVHTVDESTRATALARQTPGVSMVLNRVTIRTAVTDENPMAVPDTSRVADAVRPVTPEGPTA